MNNVSQLAAKEIQKAHEVSESIQIEGLVEHIQLNGLNLQAEATRQMSNLETISASWVICDSWAGVAGTIALAISQGGPATLIYGPIVTMVLVGACAMTLAELASVYPTAGGQYHWTSILAPKSINRSLVCTLPAQVFCCTLWKQLSTADPNSELLVWYDKHVFLDRDLHRNCDHSSTTDLRDRDILQPDLYTSTVALISYLPSHQRSGVAI